MNAVADRIELEVLLQAPPDVAWRAVSQPEQLAGWFCDAAVIDARPGGRGAFTFDQRAILPIAGFNSLFQFSDRCSQFWLTHHRQCIGNAL